MDGERISKIRQKRRERGLWQRRFWAHLIEDQEDYNHHVDYIHWNTVTRPCEKRNRLASFQFSPLFKTGYLYQRLGQW